MEETFSFNPKGRSVGISRTLSLAEGRVVTRNEEIDDDFIRYLVDERNGLLHRGVFLLGLGKWRRGSLLFEIKRFSRLTLLGNIVSSLEVQFLQHIEGFLFFGVTDIGLFFDSQVQSQLFRTAKRKEVIEVEQLDRHQQQEDLLNQDQSELLPIFLFF